MDRRAWVLAALLVAVVGSLGHAVPAAAAATTPCATASMTATDFPSPAAPGGSVTFGASSTGCANAEYRFFLQQPGGPWLAQTGYGSATWVWSSAGLNAGVYGVGVWARQQGSVAPYEAYWIGTYTLNLVTCSTAWLGSATPTGMPAGTQVVWMAGASPCSSPLFKFWIKAPGSDWHLTRGWGGNVWTWDTTGLAGGTYLVGVWAYQPKSPSSYDSYGITTFVISGGGVCNSTTLLISQSAPVAPGTIVNLGVASNCPTPEYEFWVKPPGGAWQINLSYESTGASAWDTTGLENGTWQLGLWVRIQGWNVSYLAYYVTTFQLDVGRCTAAMLAVGMPLPPDVSFVAGTTIDCASPVFQYWVLGPNSSTWQLLQPYSPAANYTLNPTGLPRGPYRIGVWVRQSGGTTSYDSYAIVTYWVT